MSMKKQDGQQSMTMTALESGGSAFAVAKL